MIYYITLYILLHAVLHRFYVRLHNSFFVYTCFTLGLHEYLNGFLHNTLHPITCLNTLQALVKSPAPGYGTGADADVISVCLRRLGGPNCFSQGCKTIVIAMVVTAMQAMSHPVPW